MTEQPQAASALPVDLAEMKNTVGGKMEVVLVLVDHILVEYPEKLEQLRHGLEKGDAGQVRAIAHGLKSSLASFGAAKARDLAFGLEVSAVTGELAGSGQVFAQLEQEIERIIVFFLDPNWMDKV